MTEQDLGGITGVLSLAPGVGDESVASLQSRDFRGLSGITTLNASGNGLTTLPSGLFDGLRSLRNVDFSGNPGAPFTLFAELREAGVNSVSVHLPEGAPVNITGGLLADGATFGSNGSRTSFEVLAGHTESGPISVEGYS